MEKRDYNKMLPFINGTIKITLIVFLCMVWTGLKSQETFSIVAVDSVTGEIGSAGATCLGASASAPYGAVVISDVIPGIGAVNTQSYYNELNQLNAHNWMMQGLSPDEILQNLITYDAGGSPSVRQYGIVDYNDGHPRAASFTGTNCFDFKDDTSRIYYSIQGNMLLGQQIIDSMQARFLNTPGALADRLMAALQGANVVGADTRCAPNSASSKSSYLRVAKPNNQPDSLYCDLYMAYPDNMGGIFPVDPIDSLQTLFNEWKLLIVNSQQKPNPGPQVSVKTVANGEVTFHLSGITDYLDARLELYNVSGTRLNSMEITSPIQTIHVKHKGVVIYKVFNKATKPISEGKFVVL